MSRSYKKNPVIKDNGKGGKWAKRDANRSFRRRKKTDIHCAKSNSYRKYYCSWNIHDHVSRWSEYEAAADWDREEMLIKNGITDRYHIFWHREFRTKECFMNYWKKCVKRK